MIKIIEVYPNILVGSEEDYVRYADSHEDYVAVIHACKEPYHRNRLRYTTSGAPKDLGEAYYYVEDDGGADPVSELYLNIVDAGLSKYLPNILFEKSCEFINKHINEGKILIHCNRGESRSVGIAITYLYKYTDFFEEGGDYVSVINQFWKVYPYINLGGGMTMKLNEIINVDIK